MASLILFGTFAVLMLIGTPIAFCLGAASFAASQMPWSPMSRTALVSMA